MLYVFVNSFIIGFISCSEFGATSENSSCYLQIGTDRLFSSFHLSSINIINSACYWTFTLSLKYILEREENTLTLLFTSCFYVVRYLCGIHVITHPNTIKLFCTVWPVRWYRLIYCIERFQILNKHLGVWEVVWYLNDPYHIGKYKSCNEIAYSKYLFFFLFSFQLD